MNRIVNNPAGSIVGYKYFNFSKTRGREDVRLVLRLVPEGVDGTITVWADRPWQSQGGKVLGTLDLTADMPLVSTELAVPQPALVDIEGHDHAITRNLPDQYVAPATEFYQWQPDPRANPDILVLASLSPRNFPLGLKDIVFGGDFPVVWTNTKYRMVYINMGHGDECFSDATQNLLFVNAFRFVVSCGGSL